MKKGFTLIEVMIALTILGIILMALTHATITIIKHNAYLEHKKTAIQIAEATINYLTNLPYNDELLSDIVNSNTFINNPHPDPNGNGNVYLLDNGNDQYDGNADITDANDATSGIDHPSTTLTIATYNTITPITKVSSKTYYKIWGIDTAADWKNIVVVVYWFEGNNTNTPHFVTLKTIKRQP